MIVNLEPNGEAFAKQVMRLRRQLNPLVAANDADEKTVLGGVQARLLTASFVPFLTALRAELMSGAVTPEQLVAAISNLCGNIALTTIHTLLDAPAGVIAEQVEAVLVEACHIACRSIAQGVAEQEAAKTKAIFTVIDGGRSDIATKTVIHDARKPEGE